MLKRLTLAEMQNIASSKGGQCLSSEYKNAHTKLLWQCSKGHIWEATPDKIKNSKSWCHECFGRKKYSIKSMQEIAESRGGKCLSSEYINIKSKLLWQCSEGHEWKAVPDVVVNRNSWCAECSHDKKNQELLTDMQNLAKSKGGKCLSTKYINNSTKMLWQCSEGHHWEANAKSLKHSDTWCPKCTQQKFLDELIETAKSRGGKCLSSKYINNSTKMLWQCSAGHQWKDNAAHIKSMNRWCPECKKNLRRKRIQKKAITIMKEIAKSKGGKCLSSDDSYINDKSKLSFECAKGHKWKTSFGSIKGLDTWCPVCAGNIPVPTSDLQKLAKSRGGKLLSQEYINTREKYDWECSLGHKFSNTWGHIRSGQWCPTCSKSGISEEVCRTTFEQIFNSDFSKVRPKWLKNERGYQMEIDGFSEELQIGFEYQGIQHFKKDTQYITTNEKLEQRIHDDKFKAQLCKDKGISLFILTYKNEYSDFPREIKLQAIKFGIDISRFNFNKKIDLNKAYIRNDRINELRDILNSKDIELLSNKFLGVREKYKARCRIDNHQWSATGSEFFSGAGCKKCSMRILHKKQTGNINNVKEYADKFDGKVLTKEYLGSGGKYHFQCKKGHVFFAKLTNLKSRKQWCPFCENRTIRKSTLKY
jgi:hypothetical protein